MDIDELADVLESGQCSRDRCNSPIASVAPDGFTVGCVECPWEESCGWFDAMGWLSADCPNCRSGAETSGDIRLVGTRSYEVKQYRNYAPDVDLQPFARPDRPDYWEVLVHYTKQPNFLAIMRSERITALATGYFNVPAVCLTEAPVRFSAEFKKRYGPFGIAFKKSDVLRAGGAPAVYLPDSVLTAQYGLGFSVELKPFINVLRIPSTAPAGAIAKRVDYLHDREWRLPKDLAFSAVPPIGIIFPDEDAARGFHGPGGDELIRIGWKYGEVRI